jgi:cytochrome c
MGCNGTSPVDDIVVNKIALTDKQIQQGAKTFKYKCAACHSMDPLAEQFFGPHLNHIVGRPIGKLTTYEFSADVASFNFIWTRERLEQWLENPQQMVPNMCMPFLGLTNAEQRQSLIGYMQQASTP